MVSVHLRVPHALVDAPAERLARFVARVESTRIDGVAVGDHVSFRDGTGYDGLIQATALAALSDRLTISTAVYLLALRHPVVAARQVASLCMLAPGRFVFGVGLGGDDPHELEVCGVDPRHRGQRLDASLDIVSALLRGETVASDGPIFSMPDVTIRPVPEQPPRLTIGGRSPAALRRAGRVGDGWIGVWLSPEKVANAIAEVDAHARSFGRGDRPQRHCYTVWCGLGTDPSTSRQQVAAAMEHLYQVPFDRFERYVPCGTASHIADHLLPYVDAGIDDVVVIGVADDHDALIDITAEIRSRLDELSGASPA